MNIWAQHLKQAISASDEDQVLLLLREEVQQPLTYSLPLLVLTSMWAFKENKIKVLDGLCSPPSPDSFNAVEQVLYVPQTCAMFKNHLDHHLEDYQWFKNLKTHLTSWFPRQSGSHQALGMMVLNMICHLDPLLALDLSSQTPRPPFSPPLLLKHIWGKDDTHGHLSSYRLHQQHWKNQITASEWFSACVCLARNAQPLFSADPHLSPSLALNQTNGWVNASYGALLEVAQKHQNSSSPQSQQWWEALDRCARETFPCRSEWLEKACPEWKVLHERHHLLVQTQCHPDPHPQKKRWI